MRCFPLDHFEVSALAFGLVGGDADALAGDDEAAEIVEIGPELQVVGCCGNGAVECKIFIDRSLPRSIAPSIRASALPTSCRRADVARAAASPAASTSTLWRNSITSSTSLIEGGPPTASRKGRRPISVATKAPAPCRVVTTPSARRAARKIARRTEINKGRRTKLRTFVRKVEEAIAAGNREQAIAALKAAEPVIMRSAQKGVVHRNAASRKVSRLSHRVAKLAAK